MNTFLETADIEKSRADTRCGGRSSGKPRQGVWARKRISPTFWSRLVSPVIMRRRALLDLRVVRPLAERDRVHLAEYVRWVNRHRSFGSRQPTRLHRP
jgi:hypothetical protein